MLSSRQVSLLLTTLLVLWGALALTVLVEDTWRHFVDSAIYMLCSQSLAAGEGYTYLGLPFFVRPPGLSFVLQPFVDGPPYDFHTLNLVMQVGAVASFAAAALAFRRLHGPTLGLLVALLYATNPQTVESFNRVLAELPFLALFFTGVWLVSPPRDRDAPAPGWPRLFAGSLVWSLSLYFRSVTFVALPAVVLTYLPRKDGTRWRGLAVSAVVVAGILPWMLHAGEAREQAQRPSSQLLMFDYSTAMFRVDPSDPTSEYTSTSGYLERVRRNALDMAHAIGHVQLGFNTEPRMVSGQARFTTWVVSLVLLLVLVVAWAQRRSLLDWFGLGYLAVLLLYFTFAHRLLLPLVPVILSALVHVSWRLSRALGRRLDQPQLPGGLMLMVSLMLLVLAARRIDNALKDDRKVLNFRRADELTAAYINEHLPREAVLMHEKGPIITVLTGRRCYTYRNLPGPWPEGMPEPVDYALFGPRPAFDETEGEVGKVSRAVSVPMPWYEDTSALRIYPLGDAPSPLQDAPRPQGDGRRRKRGR